MSNEKVEQKEKKRGLSCHFENELKKGGLLNPVLDRVKKDITLCLEIREKYINIYYRGGNIMRINKKNNGYIAHFDKKYCKHNHSKVIDNLFKRRRFDSNKNVEVWIKAISFLKQIMDFWFEKHPKEEREFQQLVVRENNGAGIGNYTDYFIIDIEYDNHIGARFDLVAVEWESDSAIRKLPKGYKPKLSFIEMKYGDGALDGKAGAVEHINKFEKYVNKNSLKALKDEMIAILKQKRRLGLIPALRKNKNSVEEFCDNVDFIFLLANHDPAKSKLQNVLKRIEQINIPKVEIKVSISNFMGYGLYKENVLNLSEFRKKYAQQIYSKNKL